MSDTSTADATTLGLRFPDVDHSQHVDWDEIPSDEDGFYLYWEAFIQDDGPIIVLDDSDRPWVFDDDLEEWVDYEEDTSEIGEGPKMNYFWPLAKDDLDHDTACSYARSVAELPVCVVQYGDYWGLALTGGGMDLSWQLGAAAVALGYYPWTGLDIFQGSPKSTWKYGVSEIGEDRARTVVQAKIESLSAEKLRIQRELDTLAEVQQHSENES